MDDRELHRDFDLELDDRLTALVARTPGRDDPPPLPARGRRGRWALPLALASVLAAAVVATAAGAVVVRNLVAEHEGIENPGQPLAGATMECMTPPEAAAYLAAHGFDKVIWQVESGTMIAPDGGKGTSRTQSGPTPPEHGYVVPGSLHEDGTVYMIADQREGATGVGACFGAPMP